jgi:PKD repeat protein
VNGTTSTVVRAPIAPDVMPSGQVMLRVAATPIGDDASQLAPGVDAKPRMVNIELVPLDGAAAPNRLPVPDFTISPPSATIFQTVTFDASLTRDEGVVCGDRCSYNWDFGANVATKNGRIVTVAFPTVATINVTLHVTDERGGTASTSQSMRINGPAAPVAAFTATPSTVTGGSGVAILFDASSTTVGAGATIVDYTWDFGDLATGSGQVTSHPYGAVSVTTSRTVTLTVTDDLGRKSQRSNIVTVTP